MKTKSKLYCLIASLLALFAFLLCFTACGEGGVENDYTDFPDGVDIVTVTVNRKIVYSVSVYAETNDVDAAYGNVSAKCSEFGGYVQSQNVYSDSEGTSSVNLVYRVPTENLNDFLSAVEACGNVYSMSVSTDDITTQYVDASAQKNALEERKKSLQEILTQEGIATGDKITVINEIYEVEEALQAIELQLENYDSLVDFSKVSLTIYRSGVDVDVGAIFTGVIIALSIIILIVCVCVLEHKRKKAERIANEYKAICQNDRKNQ